MSLLLTALAGTLLTAGGPAFIEDDYPRALARAKRENKVLFVDVWAPWCPSCLVMRAEVLSQSELRAFEDQLVFATIDTERARNAEFLRRFPVDVWPTLLFVDPRRQEVLVRWAGSADLQQLRALILASRHPSEGDALLGQGKLEAAAVAYLRSLGAPGESDGGAAGDGGAHRAGLDGGGDGGSVGEDAFEAGPEGNAEAARAALTAVLTLLLSQQLEPCVRASEAAWSYVTRPKDRASLASLALSCALELEPGAPEVLERRRLFAERAGALLAAKEALETDGALPDVVSGLFEVAVHERSAAGDVPGARALAVSWLDSLDAHAAKAPSALTRAALDGHRVSAALAAGAPERALEALARSERDFPADYNPPARLARLYQELSRLDEALAAIDRALARCTEGPRRLRLFQLKVSVLLARGDDAAARSTLARAEAWAQRLPRSKQVDRWTRWAAEERARLAARAPRSKPGKTK